VKFAGPKTEQPQQVTTQGDGFFDPEKSIDPDMARHFNAELKKRDDKIAAFDARFGTIEREYETRTKETFAKQAVMSVVDEMAQIAQRIPALKAITGFREAAQAVLDGKADPRLDVFQDLFDIAKEEGCTLRAAYDIKRGRDSDRELAVAKEQGRKEAYNVKPNPSLSGQTGNKGEDSYQPVTDAMLEQLETDPKSHPESWYDKNDELIKSKVPKRAWKVMGLA